MTTSHKIRTLSEMRQIVAEVKERGQKVVFTNGCFDLLHNGHVRYLFQASTLGDVFVVAVNSDASVRRIKGSDRPLTPASERMEVLAALFFVEFVFEFDEDDPAEVIEALVPDVLVKGSDWAMDEIVGRECVTAHGGTVERIPLVNGISTTRIIERIKQGESDLNSNSGER